MKRSILSRVLCAFTLASLLLGAVSCGSDQPSDAVTTDASAETDVAGAETTAEITDSLPDTDLDGYNFRMLILGEDYVPYAYSDELDGSVVNDAVYTKITAVEERFNTDITLVENSSVADSVDLIKSEIMAGTDSFDIAQGHDVNMANASLEGLFMNLYDVPYLDFEKPWWPAATIESMTVAGQMYMMINNITLINLASTRVMYFNKTLFDTYDLAYPYQEVYDGTWTLDRLITLSASAYQDLNGDSKIDAEDSFGLVSPKWYYCWLEPFDLEPYHKDANGTLYYEFDMEKMTTLVEKFYTLLFGDGGFQTPDGDVGADKIFTEGRSLFRYDMLKTAATTYSTTDVIYGILPMPKFNENQDQYYGGSTDRPIAIPVTAASNIDKAGIVVEALNYEGYRKAFPAYYELALKSRYADQTDDASMIDLIYENVIISFTYMFGNYASPYNNMLDTLFNAPTPSTDVASYAAKGEKTQSKYLERLMTFYTEQAEQAS